MAEQSREQKIKAQADDASKALESDIILLNSEIEGATDLAFIDMVVRRKRKPMIYLILVTEGGSADSAYRIARCLQSCYRRFIVVVPGWCKSAGTLVCIGAHDLKVGDLGELGPLDVQLTKPDELALVASGLTIDSSFRGLKSVVFQMFESFMLDMINKSGGRITTKTAADLAASLTTGLMSPIFGQIDPMRVGEDYRSTRVAEEYALRLNAHAQNLIFISDESSAVDTLVRGYPSHGFVIDRTEANTLFSRVDDIPEPLRGLVETLGPDAIVPRSSRRGQQPTIVQYLNSEEAHEQSAAKPPATGDKSPGGRRASAATGPKPEPVPPASPEGDGKLTV